MNSAQPPLLSPARRRLSVFLKITGIGFLIALLHIPLGLTHGVLRERQGYQRQASDEIAAVWGRQQTVIGPVLVVPYARKSQVIRTRLVQGQKTDVEVTELVAGEAYFLPDTLAIEGALEPEVRHRGIYEAVVYAANLKFAGRFVPDFAAAGIAADRIDWDKARVLLGISDLRGIRSVTGIRLGGQSFAFEAADEGSLLPLSANVAGLTATGADFSLEASLQGSERIELAPVGKATTARLESSWADPSFMGAYLPVERTVADAGFNARWETSHFSRGFPGSWTDRSGSPADLRGKIAAAAFGVRFDQPADGYSMVERAGKYGVLFFVLVFAVFFLFEATGGVRIHPLQYGMVGAALCLFFLGFLALSEFVPTGAAYGAAAAACTVLVALYAWSFLRSGRRTFVIGGGLGVTYGYLYFVLKSQDYALLAGTAALFAALALVMFCTRRLDWYALDTTKEAGS